jgi:hypothetical protein
MAAPQPRRSRMSRRLVSTPHPPPRLPGWSCLCSGYVLVVWDGRPQPVRTRLVGGPQDGRVDRWYTLAPEDLPGGWAFPRTVSTPEGEAVVQDHYRLRPDQVPAYGAEVLYDYEHTTPADQT